MYSIQFSVGRPDCLHTPHLASRFTPVAYGAVDDRRNKTTARKLRTALRTVETSSYTYFGVVWRSLSFAKLSAYWLAGLWHGRGLGFESPRAYHSFRSLREKRQKTSPV